MDPNEPMAVTDPPKEIAAKKSIGVGGIATTVVLGYLNLDDETRGVAHTFITNLIGSHPRLVISGLGVFGLSAWIQYVIRKTWPDEPHRPVWAAVLLNACDPITFNFWRLRTGRPPGSSASIPKPQKNDDGGV